MLCAATGGLVPTCGSFDTLDGRIAGSLTTFRPVSLEIQPRPLGSARAIGSGAVSIAGCCVADTESRSAVDGASGAGLVIFWITNLWRGERLDDMTLNRAPLIEHLNSTSLSSIVSGWNHWALQFGQLTVPRLPSGMRNFRLQTGQTMIAKISFPSRRSGEALVALRKSRMRVRGCGRGDHTPELGSDIIP
jgi:hypothetical protein